MRIAFCTAHPFLPQLVGGAQQSMLQLANEVTQLGHSVGFLAGLSGRGRIGLNARIKLKLLNLGLAKDSFENYEVYRGWFAEKHVPEFVRRFRPDVAVCFSGRPASLARSFKETSIRSIIYFRNVETDDLGGSISNAADDYIANSEFTKEHMKREFGIDSFVIPPLVDSVLYKTTAGSHVTFINPHFLKGKDKAFAIIRANPDIKFMIVKAWSLGKDDIADLNELCRDCSNVSVMGPTNRMIDIYKETKIVLAPSQWQEAWGRVATEAHFSGIPVLASDVGGLSESVGPGGILLPPDATNDHWVSTLRSMYFDENLYRRLSSQAMKFGQRNEITKSYLVSKFLKIAEQRANL